MNKHESSTRLEALKRLKKIGIKIWEDDIEKANFDNQNDPAVEIRIILTPDQVDQLFIKFAKDNGVWDGTKKEQENILGTSLLTVVETLETLRLYVEEKGHLPYPKIWWALRCYELFGNDESLIVSCCPEHKLDVWHDKVTDSHPRIGAFPARCIGLMQERHT